MSDVMIIIKTCKETLTAGTLHFIMPNPIMPNPFPFKPQHRKLGESRETEPAESARGD